MDEENVNIYTRQRVRVNKDHDNWYFRTISLKTFMIVYVISTHIIVI